MTDPATLRVVYRRDPCGAVASVEIWDGESLFLDTAENDDPMAALNHLLVVARGYYRAAPGDDTLPPDHAVINAYWDHLA